jgi:hypothetical protein
MQALRLRNVIRYETAALRIPPSMKGKKTNKNEKSRSLDRLLSGRAETLSAHADSMLP